jgi:hypothetical protein
MQCHISKDLNPQNLYHTLLFKHTYYSDHYTDVFVPSQRTGVKVACQKFEVHQLEVIIHLVQNDKFSPLCMNSQQVKNVTLLPLCVVSIEVRHLYFDVLNLYVKCRY